MMVVRTLVLDVSKHLRTRLTEWLMAAYLLVMGARLIGPGETFASSPSYAHMASIMTENHWGECILVVASLRITALIVNGTWRPFAPYSPLIRSGTAFLSAIVWYFITTTLYIGNPAGTGWSNYGLSMLADIYLAIVIAKDAGLARRKHEHGRP